MVVDLKKQKQKQKELKFKEQIMALIWQDFHTQTFQSILK